MTDADFPPDTAAGIVEHMNEDHADAVLAIARAHCGAPDATSARLLSITPRELVVEVTEADETRAARTVLDPPIAPLDTVRARLVTMTKDARAALAS